LPKLNNKCEICGGNSPGRGLDLHEVWSYDIKTKTQKLERLEGLCIYCHEAKHYFLAHIKGNGERAKKRIKKINGFSELDMYKYEDKVQREFELISQLEWSLDISLIKDI
jgi:hypothetical protein